MEDMEKIQIDLELIINFQVLIKPSPDNIQDLYLQSLEFLGLDVSRHDIRFVEDNWESPTLGAWGLGWEVWLGWNGSNTIYLFPTSRRTSM